MNDSKVIFQCIYIGKVKFGSFSHSSLFYGRAAQMYCIMYIFNGERSKKVRKVQFGTLLSIKTNISETVNAIIYVCMKHIYKVIYDISVYLMTFGDIKMSNQGHLLSMVVSHKCTFV